MLRLPEYVTIEEGAKELRELQGPDYPTRFLVFKLSFLAAVMVLLILGTYLWNIPEAGLTFLVGLVAGMIAILSVAMGPRTYRHRRELLFWSAVSNESQMYEYLEIMRREGVNLSDVVLHQVIREEAQADPKRKEELLALLDLLKSDKHSFVL